MDADQRRKNDEYPESKGGETKLLRGRKARNTEPFRLRRPRQAHCTENFISVDGTPTRYPGNLSAEEQTQFSKAIETEWQGVLDFKAVTIIDSVQADVKRDKRGERVVSSRLVLRWKETDT